MKTFIRRKNQGQTIVEFACILPILLILTLLMVQYGILLNTRLSLYHVSRNVGRYAAVKAMNPGSNTDIRTYGVNVAKSFNITIKDTDITFYKYDPSVTTPVVSIENTVDINTNRPQHSSLNVRIAYDAKQKLFLPATFFGIKVFNSVITIDNIVMIE